MKKAFLLVLSIVFAVTLTACTQRDNEHAVVTLTTSSGEAYLWDSVNGSGATITGRELAFRNQSNLTLKEGETATITFKCDTCGDSQEYVIDYPWSAMLYCNCPEEPNAEGNLREYTSICISYE